LDYYLLIDFLKLEKIIKTTLHYLLVLCHKQIIFLLIHFLHSYNHLQRQKIRYIKPAKLVKNPIARLPNITIMQNVPHLQQNFSVSIINSF